jgi:hypothetical protein
MSIQGSTTGAVKRLVLSPAPGSGALLYSGLRLPPFLWRPAKPLLEVIVCPVSENGLYSLGCAKAVREA